MRNWNFTRATFGIFWSTEATWHVSRMGCRLKSGWNRNFSFENIEEVHASYPSHLPAASNSWCLTNPEWCGWPQTQHVPWLLSPMALKARMSSSEHLLGLRGRHGTAEVLPLLVAISWQRCGHCMETTMVSSRIPCVHKFTESLLRVSGTAGNCRCDWPRGKGWTIHFWLIDPSPGFEIDRRPGGAVRLMFGSSTEGCGRFRMASEPSRAPFRTEVYRFSDFYTLFQLYKLYLLWKYEVNWSDVLVVSCAFSTCLIGMGEWCKGIEVSYIHTSVTSWNFLVIFILSHFGSKL